MKHVTPPLKASFDDPVDEPMLQRIWQRIESRAPSGGSKLARVALFGAGMTAGAAAVVVCAFLLSGTGRSAPGPLVLPDGRQPAAEEIRSGGAPLAWDLSDGSRVRLTSRGRVEPLENSGSAFGLILVRGAASFDVRPGGPRRWTIETGLATVEVVGTSFVVERTETSVRVAVGRGTVLVRGERVPQRVRRLVAGEALEIGEAPPDGHQPGAAALPAAAAPSAAAPPAPLPDASIVPDASATPPVEEVAAPASRAPRRSASSSGPDAAAPTTWRELADEGQHREAFSLLGVEGVRRETSRLGVTDLLALADVARLSGHPHEAVAPLERILAEFPADAQAPLAAFALGRLELDALDRPADATVAFGRALALGVPATLREDVLARLVEAHVRTGNRDEAAAAARAYARDFPAGRHLGAVRRWLETGR